MKILVVGGTVFVGRHLTDAARARGHEVTLLNRGKSCPDVFPDVESVQGDREDSETWGALSGRTFDAVIDTCGYVPRVVSISADALKAHVGRYVFISTISVFRDFTQVGMDENAPLGEMQEDTEAVTGATYGPLKVQCEQVVSEVYGERALIVRPGFIVGPYDSTDRFTYWPHRIAEGGDVLCPGAPDASIQFIDGRDLAEWTIRLIEQQTPGVFNATGPKYGLTWGTFLEMCRSVSGSEARLVWVPDEVLATKEVGGGQLPLYTAASADHAGLMTVDCGKAIAHGLTFRALAETVADTLAWDAARDQTQAFQKTITREKEAAVLATSGLG